MKTKLNYIWQKMYLTKFITKPFATDATFIQFVYRR